MGSAKVAPEDGDASIREQAAVNIQKRARGMTARKSLHDATPSQPHESFEQKKQSSEVTSRKSPFRREGTSALVVTGGLDMDGAGLSVQNGQLAQAADRDFVSAFAGCYDAISGVRSLSDPGCGLRPLVAELRMIEPMLRAIEDSFNIQRRGGKTIVSLKQLLTQLREAEEAARAYAHPPPAGCFGCQRNRAAEARYLLDPDPALSKIAKATQQYAKALLLEHGYAASDYTMFASRQAEAG